MPISEDYIKFCRILNGENISDSVQVKKNLKLFIYNNPDHIISYRIKNWLLNNIQSAFLNPDLKNAINMSDEFKYTKKFEIFKNLPFMNKDREIPRFFYDLLYTDSSFYGTYPYFYNGARWFSNEMEKNYVPDEIFDKCIEFCNTENTIMNGGRNNYNTYSYEYQTLKILDKGNVTPEYNKRYNIIKEELYWSGKPYEEYDIKTYFRNEKKSIVGEYFIYNWLNSKNGETTFVAKEYGNGFGYDIHYKTNDTEYLVEVKSTENKLDNNDYFTLTSNEKDVLEDSFNLPKTVFILERVFINTEKDEITHIPFIYDKDNKYFYSNQNPEYDIKYVQSEDDPLRYNAVLTKKNILTYKNSNQ